MRDVPRWPATDPVTDRREVTPDRTALIDAATGDAWDYREYDRRVERVRRSSPFEPGTRIGVLLSARPAFSLLPFAAMRAGAALVLLPTRETTTELAEKADRAGIDALVCGATTEEDALELADGRLPVSSVDDPTDPAVDRLRTDPAPESSRNRPELDPDRTLLIAFTSGTGGEPKGVRLTAGNLLASAQASAYRLGVLPGDRWLSPLAMYHVGGLAPTIRCALYGTAVVIQRAFDAEGTPTVIEAEGVTCLSLVPTMLRRLLDAGWTPPDSLRFVLLGGAPASEGLLEDAARAGIAVCPTYGMTEAASQIATVAPTDDPTARPGTVGQALSSASVSIVDDDGRPVDPGERGELVVDGPMVTPGYLEDARTREAFGPQGLATGDVGYRDQEGYLRITGRRSDRIVTGGENVDPGEVVEAIEDHPAVARAAVVGLPDPEWGERVGSVVVPAGEHPSLEALRAHLEGRLAGFKRPKTIAFAEALPRTASGTVDREAVRDRLLAEERSTESGSDGGS